MSIRNILFLFSLMMILSSPTYAGFWDFLKRDKTKAAESTQVENVGEVSESPNASDTDGAIEPEKIKKADANEETKIKAAEAAKKIESDKAAEAAKQAESVKAAEAAKKIESDKAAEAVKQAEAVKAAEAAKKIESDKAAEAVKQAEAVKAAEAAKKIESDKAAEAVKQAESVKAAEAAKKIESDKATEAAKQAESVKVAEAAKKIESDKAAEAAKQAESVKAAEAAKKIESDKAAEAAKQAESVKAAEAAKKAESDKAAEAAKQAESVKAAEAAKKIESDKAAEAAKQAESVKAAAEAAKKAESDKAAEAAKQAAAVKAAEAAKKAELDKAAEAAKQAESVKAAEIAKKAESDKAAEAAKKADADKPAATLPAAKGRLTAMGAEVNGNGDGSIPAATEKMNGVPAGLTYNRSGDPYPDPYAKEQPLFTIHAGNMDKYADKMGEGVKALMKKFPDSFVMNVYPSHRDGKIDDLVLQRTTWNSTRTELVNGLDGLHNYTGGIPFPNPKNAAEVMWNGRIAHPNPTLNGTMDDMAVYLNGNNQMRRQVYIGEFPFSNRANPLGKVDDQVGINAAYVLVTIEKPDRQKGQMTIVHEALDQVRGERKAWVYIPGSRRVRRAPTVGFDTPDGPGGLVTIDDSLGFNGAMVRYNWTLVGKKEIYIPYNNYKFDDPKVDYATLLGEGHANPDYMRYELHRVWVVEATLKSGQRHVYAKRRFYLDEDSWQFVLVDSYDGRGNLWRVGILNTLYDFLLKGYVARAQVYHDLQSGAYIAQRLVNETGQMRLMDTPKGDNFYTPANLRTMGK